MKRLELEPSRWNSIPVGEKLRLLTQSYVEANTLAKKDLEFGKKAREMFAMMENAWLRGETSKNNEKLALWQEFRDISEDYLKNFYKRFLVHFDVWEAESNYIADAHRLADELIGEGKAYLNKNNLWCINADEKNYYVLRKSDNTTLYLSR
jgi:arginyl-tRNA synthetase